MSIFRDSFSLFYIITTPRKYKPTLSDTYLYFGKVMQFRLYFLIKEISSVHDKTDLIQRARVIQLVNYS